MFVVIGARDFSPEITVHLIGTKVPCFDKVPPLKFQFIAQWGGLLSKLLIFLLLTKSLEHMRSKARFNYKFGLTQRANWSRITPEHMNMVSLIARWWWPLQREHA